MIDMNFPLLVTPKVERTTLQKIINELLLWLRIQNNVSCAVMSTTCIRLVFDKEQLKWKSIGLIMLIDKIMVMVVL